MSSKSSVLLCLLSSLFLILAFPSPGIAFFAWFGLVPLLWAIDNKGPKEAFFLSCLTGAIFFLGTLYWLSYVSSLGLVLLVLYLALYFGIFGLLANLIGPQYTKRRVIIRLLFLPCLWVGLEFIRSHLFTGFGWALLGYSQYLNLPFIQISDFTGAYGVSFLVVVVNVAIKEIIAEKRRTGVKIYRRRRSIIIIPLLCLLLSFGYGFFKFHHQLESKRLKVAVIQGNVPQHQKWDQRLKQLILERYERLTRTAAFDEPNIIIWPETSVPGYLEDEPLLLDRISSLAKDIKVPLLVGTPSTSSAQLPGGGDTSAITYYNSAILFSGQGEVVARYDKIHLVPFGEYLPLKNLVPFLKRFIPMIGDFSPGDQYTLFQLPSPEAEQSPKFGVLICFEDIFPGLVREFVRQGADFMVNITNDAWFGKYSAPYQHAQASVFRAVENGVNVVRCANTGLSGFIDPRGKITERVSDAKGRDIFVTGYKTATIALAASPTFYTRYGDLFSIFCIAISLGIICLRVFLTQR